MPRQIKLSQIRNLLSSHKKINKILECARIRKDNDSEQYDKNITHADLQDVYMKGSYENIVDLISYDIGHCEIIGKVLSKDDVFRIMKMCNKNGVHHHLWGYVT